MGQTTDGALLLPLLAVIGRRFFLGIGPALLIWFLQFVGWYFSLNHALFKPSSGESLGNVPKYIYLHTVNGSIGGTE